MALATLPGFLSDELLKDVLNQKEERGILQSVLSHLC